MTRVPNTDSDRRHPRGVRIPSAPSLAAVLLWSLLASGCSLFAPRPAPPPPPLTYDIHGYEKIEPGCGDHGHRDEACVSFRATWPEFKGNDAAPKFNVAVFNALGFPNGVSELEPYSVALIERWRTEHKGVLYADSTWFERRSIQVLARRPEVWSLQLDRIGQTGGETPFDQRVYFDLDPRNGSTVTLDSLLEKDAAPRLAALAEQRLRETLAVDSTAQLPLKDGRFAMPASYAVTQAGIVLLWSGDALSDPAAPRVEVTLQWNQSRNLVRTSAVDPPSPEAGRGF